MQAIVQTNEGCAIHLTLSTLHRILLFHSLLRPRDVRCAAMNTPACVLIRPLLSGLMNIYSLASRTSSIIRRCDKTSLAKGLASTCQSKTILLIIFAVGKLHSVSLCTLTGIAILISITLKYSIKCSIYSATLVLPRACHAHLLQVSF